MHHQQLSTVRVATCSNCRVWWHRYKPKAERPDANCSLTPLLSFFFSPVFRSPPPPLSSSSSFLFTFPLFGHPSPLSEQQQHHDPPAVLDHLDLIKTSSSPNLQTSFSPAHMSGTSMLAPLLRHAARHAARPSSAATALRPSIMAACRALHNGSPRRDKPGNYARTDSHIEVAHPAEHELPSSQPVLGTGGQFVKPTLPSFSLDGRVGVVTGGARGLGLVMAQGMVFSGADVALVDMNGLCLGRTHTHIHTPIYIKSTR